MADILNIIHSKKAQMPKKEQFLAEYISLLFKNYLKILVLVQQRLFDSAKKLGLMDLVN